MRCITNERFFSISSLVPCLIARPASQVSLWLRHSLPHCRSQPLYFSQTLGRYRATPSLLHLPTLAHALQILLRKNCSNHLTAVVLASLYSSAEQAAATPPFSRRRQSLPQIGCGVKSRSLLPSSSATVKQFL